MGVFVLIYVGIDVAKDKHDCCIMDQNEKELYPIFTFRNSQKGLSELFDKIQTASCIPDSSSALATAGENIAANNVMVGLEATGHYSYNLLNALSERGFSTCLINPLHTNLYRKGNSLRKTKTDRVDAAAIARMLIHDRSLKRYTGIADYTDELKSLTRYRFDRVQDRARLKISIARLVTILFPELERLVPDLHINSVYTLLEEYPGASFVAKAPVKRLQELLEQSSRGHYSLEKAKAVRDAAKNSIAITMPSRSLELQYTIRLIRTMDEEIEAIEKSLKSLMDTINPPILTIPGISYRMGAMILAEVGDFARFDNADKLLAYAGLSPSTYQSGQLVSTYCHMEKRGSKYLRYALFNTTRFVCQWDPTFSAYLSKKMAEGKHYNVAISHAAKKLLRVMYRMQLTGEPYRRTQKTEPPH